MTAPHLRLAPLQSLALKLLIVAADALPRDPAWHVDK
jgi:hypothetical protein